MNVWLDDERPMPDGYDVHVKTAQAAIDLIKTGDVEVISLDHDLGDECNGNGYQVARFIEECAFNNSVPRMRVRIHSQNPVGVQNMKSAIRQAVLYWMKWA